MSILITLAILSIVSLQIYLEYRQVKCINNNINKVPQEFINTISIENHQKAGLYNIDKSKLHVIELVISLMTLLLFTYGGILNSINDLIYKFNLDNISSQLLIIISYLLITGLIQLPLSVYSIFHIEQKFGFNKMTIKLFIIDFIKTTFISTVIGIPLLYIIFYLMSQMNSYWWIYTWIVFCIFNLLIVIIYPMIIAPLFNKFTLLDDPLLKTKITELLNKCGFKARKIYIMNGSLRSTHGNAYFTGIGKSKRIVFFDTLIDNLQISEIEAILAHELGHFKKKHIIKQILLSFIISLFVFYLLDIAIHSRNFYTNLGVNNFNDANALILLLLLLGTLAFPLKLILSHISRKYEFEADAFATKYSKKEYLISGLVKLYKDNAVTLTPDDWYVRFYYSHPPAVTRIKFLNKNLL